MGVGAYYLVSTNRRLIIVITKSLDPPASIPPDNLILSDNQHEQIEPFANHWVAWTEAQFPRPADRWNWLKVATPLELY